MPKLKRRSISQKNTGMTRRMRERRADDGFSLSDNRRRANSHKIERQDNELKTEENRKRAETLKAERQDLEFKTEERRRNALRMRDTRDNYRSKFYRLISDYASKIKEGPTQMCSCCGGVWFKYSIREYTANMLRNKGLKPKFIDTVCYLKDAAIKLCVNCRKDMMSNRVPNMNLSNGLAFYEVPDCLKILSELEELLVSPRISFMVIQSLGSCR